MNPLLHKLEQSTTNPLRAAVGPMRSPGQLLQALINEPITPENVAQVPLAQRIALVDAFKTIFVPTEATLEIAIALQAMLYEGLDRRDPRLKNNRRFILDSAALKGQAFADVEPFPAEDSTALGLTIEGITGLGKSMVVERFLNLFPQVVGHGDDAACGWCALKQLVWLRVHLPSDGTRGGFLTAAFLELDRALGTGYAEQYARWTVERKLVIFLHLLSLHRCGLLVIEEAQDKALGELAPFADEFLTFFLRLLNYGVPTVLIGNPLAFVRLNRFSQNTSRFAEGGSFRLEPVMDPASDDWSSLWIPRLWKPTLLDEPDEDYRAVSDHPLDKTLEGFVWRRTAGIPRLVARLRREVQTRALMLGLSRVTAPLVDHVFHSSEKFTKEHPLIDAFVRKDAHALEAWRDIPSADYQKRWPAQECSSADHPPPPVVTSASPGREGGTAVRKRSARKNSRSAPARDRTAITPEDVRSQEFRRKLAAELTDHVAGT